jgi:peptide deformylase
VFAVLSIKTSQNKRGNMKYPIVTDLTLLRAKSETASPEVAKKIIIDLEDSLDLSRGCGLAGIQLGFLKQVAIVRLPNMKIDIINPIIIQKEGRFRNIGEGCLSLPSLKIDTVRYWAFSFVSQGTLYNLNGTDAVCAEHEIDHCFGMTLLDKKWRAR